MESIFCIDISTDTPINKPGLQSLGELSLRLVHGIPGVVRYVFSDPDMFLNILPDLDKDGIQYTTYIKEKGRLMGDNYKVG